MMKEELLYETLANDSVRCHLCAHHCVIQDGKKGICQVRENWNGVLYMLVYGRTIAKHVNPVEKKPLFIHNGRFPSYDTPIAGVWAKEQL